MILTVTANPAIDRVYFVESFEMGEVHRPLKTVFTAGGKGLNVARVAKTLGEDVMAMGFVGGYTGEFIKFEVEKLGIKNNFTQIEGETRICINIADNNGKSGEILEAGPTISSDEEQSFLNTFENYISKCDIITVSGSLPKGLGSDFYCRLVDIAQKNNKKIIIDTSGKTLEDTIKAKPYMIKPNVDELSSLIGNTDVKSALKMMLQWGIKIPLITLGKDGAAALIDGKFYKFNTPDIDVINTVGSGDSTVAGIAAGLSRGMNICDSIRLGMAAGTANTQFEQTGIVSKELVEKYFEEITVSCF